MKRFSSMRVPSVTIMFLCFSILLLSQGIGEAQVTVKPPVGQVPLPHNIQASDIPQLKLCPDLKVNLTVVKGRGGLVTLHGTVTNVGKGNYDIVSEAQVIMNLSYPPLYSYAMTGVSEILLTTPFTKVKAGASFPVNCTFQIPKFNGWVSESGQGNAKRLFTLRVVKRDMSPYTRGEDCNPENNSKYIEIDYREIKP